MNPGVGQWKDALIDIDRDVEFTGDDVDRYSKIVDLGGVYENIEVKLPTITGSVVQAYGQQGNGLTEVPLPINIFDADATGHFAHATTTGPGGFYITFHIGGFQFIRIHTDANQAADRTFSVRGVGRLS
ncbi:MAG: hypothetical protein WC455_16275 [Dehalococcoidia bacterium]|jgi:hypothetical protein